jgi:hypothetical protein
METENICYWMCFHALPYTSIGYVEKTTLRMQYTVQSHGYRKMHHLKLE